MIYGRGRKGALLAPRTLVETYYVGCLIKLSNYAFENNIKIKEVFENEKHLFSFCRKNIVSMTKLSAISAILRILDKVNNNKSGIKYKHNKVLFGNFSILLKKYKAKIEQTEVIPTSILANSLKARLNQIEELNNNKDELLKFLSAYLKDKNFASGKEKWKKDIRNKKLANIFIKYDIYNRTRFSSFIKQIQGTCKHLILAYTGMRNSECLSLNINCLI